MTLTKRILENQFPELPKKLNIAGMDVEPEEFLKKRMLSSTYLSLGLMVMTFFFVTKMDMSLLWVPVSLVFWFVTLLFFQVKSVETEIRERQAEIDKDVLFAGRFLLVKLNSGKSLINAIEEASQSYGVANHYFSKIMKDIDLGTPLEEALEKATRTCPSGKMKKILFQITNALEIGIDVSQLVESVLDDIAHEQLMEIKDYGQKLSSVALFYMLFAVVMPSLGMALLIVMASLISLNISTSAFIVMIVFLGLIEVLFITIFKHIRPDVNI